MVRMVRMVQDGQHGRDLQYGGARKRGEGVMISVTSSDYSDQMSQLNSEHGFRSGLGDGFLNEIFLNTSVQIIC